MGSVGRRLGSLTCRNEKVVVKGDTSNGGTIVTCFVVNEDRGDEGHIFIRSNSNVHARTFSRSGVISPRLVVCTPMEILNGGAVIAGNSRASAVCRLVSGRVAFRRSLHAERFRSSTPGFAPEVSNVVRVSGNRVGCTVSVLGSTSNSNDSYRECACTCRGPLYNGTGFVRACGYSKGPLPDFRNRPGALRLPSASVSALAGLV